MKNSEIINAVKNLVEQNDNLSDRLKEERVKGKEDALFFMNSKTKGFIDGGASILLEHGVAPHECHAVMDQVWDLVKSLVGNR